MFDMLKNPAGIFKILQAAGVKIKFDADNKCLVVQSDDGETRHKFEDLEKMVNGNGN